MGMTHRDHKNGGSSPMSNFINPLTPIGFCVLMLQGRARPHPS